VPRDGSTRRLGRALAESRHRARRRRSPLDPNGVIATTLASDPIHAMDVGAAGGVAPQWREYLPVLEVDCFEPDAEECARRQRESPPNLHWFPVALAGTTGRREFHVLNRPTGSSLYPPNNPVILEYSGRSYAGVRRVIEVDCMSLADFLDEHRRPMPSLMKLDTQGTELEILSSLAQVQLEGLLCVELEVEFLELYQGQPTFPAVHAFMLERGFRLLDLRTHRSYRNANDEALHYLRKYLGTAAGSSALSAELVAGDALYVREAFADAALESRGRLIAFLCLLRMYGFYDLAFWLVEKAARETTVSASDARAIAQDIATGAPRPALSQRTGVAGDITRRVLWAIGHDDHEVFWTRRKWPNQ
jgi:FkbM family methyltransferase